MLRMDFVHGVLIGIFPHVLVYRLGTIIFSLFVCAGQVKYS